MPLSSYFNIPFVGEFHLEYRGVTRRNGRLFDAACENGCFELWAGKLHMEASRPLPWRPSIGWAVKVVAVVALANAYLPQLLG